MEDTALLRMTNYLKFSQYLFLWDELGDATSPSLLDQGGITNTIKFLNDSVNYMVLREITVIKRAHDQRDGLPRWLRWQRICLQCRRPGFEPWIRKIPWRRGWLSTPVFLPGEFHGQKSPAGYSPSGCKALDMTEQLTLSLSWSVQQG